MKRKNCIYISVPKGRDILTQGAALWMNEVQKSRDSLTQGVALWMNEVQKSNH